MPHATVLLEGHILDSHILSKILDRILKNGGRYEIVDLAVGHRKDDPSRANLFVEFESETGLGPFLAFAKEQGAAIPEAEEARLEPAPADGVFPDDFYSTTNLETWVRVGDRELKVDGEGMDLGISVNPDDGRARIVPMDEVVRGRFFVVGHGGIRVVPLAEPDRARTRDAFGFMQSEVSVEKPKGRTIQALAGALKDSQASGGKNLLVLGPAVVHTGAGETIIRLLGKGTFDVLFGGNAVATHDIERALYGTSLGVDLDRGRAVPGGHHHHLRAINTIRKAGGIQQAMDAGILTTGIMHAAFRHGVDVFLAGSIRDDGPLPEVCTDVLQAKREMRKRLEGVRVAVMVATALHSIATGNLLPARVKTYCVDINPETVTKLLDRGSAQAASIVMDCESFFHELENLL